jgi:hypothetical protein
MHREHPAGLGLDGLRCQQLTGFSAEADHPKQ